MKRFFSYVILCCSLSFTACEEETALGVDTSLFQEWTHAREEQADANATQMIFRLSDSQTFAATRYRQSYIFNADGSCEYLYLDPADAHHFRTGSFSFDSEDKILTIYDGSDDLYDSFKVVELSSDKLVLERQ